MTIKDIWNNISIKQRTDLLRSIYGDSYIMFASDISKDWNGIPYGVQRRLERLNDVLKARNK